MAANSPSLSQKEILAAMTDAAKKLWGSHRAEAIRASLESTAHQLEKTGHTLPEPETEPGYFQ